MATTDGMDCPRCGGKLDVYSLGGRQSGVCTECGYVGIPADHHSEPDEPPEPWPEALKRFYRRLQPDAEPAGAGDGEEAGDGQVDYEAVVAGTIPEVKERVEADDLDVNALLEAEREGKDRVTLVEWLERHQERQESEA